jgi:hypothetical protein
VDRETAKKPTTSATCRCFNLKPASVRFTKTPVEDLHKTMLTPVSSNTAAQWPVVADAGREVLKWNLQHAV